MEVWWDCFKSPIISQRPYLRVRDKSHYRWEKMKVKALLYFRTGSLKFKTAWKIYNCKRGVGINCVHPLCDQQDTFEHAKICRFNETIWKDEFSDSEDQTAEYIMLLNRERIRKYRMPII